MLVDTAEYVIAADSGLLRLVEAGRRPDCVVGDFDSLHEALLRGAEVLDGVSAFQPDFGQEDTDCAKLLRWAHSVSAETITLTCLEGDLLDHTLDAMHTCARLGQLFGGEVRVGLSRGFGYVLNACDQPRVYATRPGARVSLIPLSGEVTVSLEGTKWSIDRQILSPTGFTSISNQALKEQLRVSIYEGSVFLFIGDS